MLVVLRLRIVSCLLLLGLGLGMLGVQVRAQTAPPPEPQAPPPLEGPAIGVEALPAAELPRGGAGFGEDRTRETPRESSPAPEVPSGRSRVYVPTAPPEPITERPSGNRPGLRGEVDRRPLGLGPGTERIRLGWRELAHSAPGVDLGGRTLDP